MAKINGCAFFLKLERHFMKCLISYKSKSRSREIDAVYNVKLLCNPC